MKKEALQVEWIDEDDDLDVDNLYETLVDKVDLITQKCHALELIWTDNAVRIRGMK
mgnify:CR=1 FL=1